MYMYVFFRSVCWTISSSPYSSPEIQTVWFSMYVHVLPMGVLMPFSEGLKICFWVGVEFEPDDTGITKVHAGNKKWYC